MNTNQSTQQPPEGIVGYAVIKGPDVKPALFVDRGQAESYAARVHGVLWPLVAAKRVIDGADMGATC